jgi:hypothetical protein
VILVTIGWTNFERLKSSRRPQNFDCRLVRTAGLEPAWEVTPEGF